MPGDVLSPGGPLLTLYVLHFSEGTKHIFTFYVLPPVTQVVEILPRVRQEMNYST